MKTVFQIFTIIIFLGVILLFQIPKTAHAQGTPTPSLQCKVDKAVITDSTGALKEISKDSIPSDTNFGLYIYCQDNSSPTAILGDYAAVSANVGSATLTAGKTVPAGYQFNFDLLFGNPFTASAGNPQLIGNNTYTVSILKSGIPVSCFSSSACQITSTLTLNTSPVPAPPTQCAYFRAYDPATPIKGQSFTIIIKNPSSGSYNANVADFTIFWYKPSLNQSGTKLLFEAPGTTNDWTANFNDVNEEFHWNVDFQGQQCGDTHVLFGPVSTSTGKNPCIDTNGDGKVDTCPTAIGNIPINLGDFATAVLRIALGISGGIVLILMVIGSIRVMTSSGDPQRVAAGRDMIVAAIAGALFIAFSVMIMQFLGTAIVPIPGLTFNF